TAPPIEGLYFDPQLRIEQSYADELVKCVLPYFRHGANQVMLFGKGTRADPTETSSTDPSSTNSENSSSGLPEFVPELVATLSRILHGHIPIETYRLLFPATPDEQIYPARQVIINLYHPGEGITPHVDLLRRYGDGIIGLSLLSGTKHQLYLPPRSILVMEKDARYLWKHGIAAREQDFIANSTLPPESGADNHAKDQEIEQELDGMWVDRHLRISITIRWMLPGAEIVGGEV
ncbi:hypothetical protein DL93DRAFT_2034416, partial [Clavulina sp. PMI_390]